MFGLAFKFQHRYIISILDIGLLFSVLLLKRMPFFSSKHVVNFDYLYFR